MLRLLKRPDWDVARSVPCETKPRPSAIFSVCRTLFFLLQGLHLAIQNPNHQQSACGCHCLKTVHIDRFGKHESKAAISAYDKRRGEHQPYGRQRAEELFGFCDLYSWSEDKSRQYAQPERQDFGVFVRKKGFSLD